MAYVGADHEFHDSDYVKEWAQRFKLSPERRRLFDDICGLIAPYVHEDGAVVVELGTGPGYLAEHLLAYFPAIQYVGVDFSSAMFDIAGDRVEEYSDRVNFVKLDLLNDTLDDLPRAPVKVIVSTWSLHDLGSAGAIQRVYQNCHGVLEGLLINGDFIDPQIDGADYEPGRIPVAQHLEMLEKIGYDQVRCIGMYEYDSESPSPSNNYACIVAEKRTTN